MDLIERFRYVMKLNSMTASQFAEEIGVQRSSVSHILSGRNKPSLEFIQKVINRFPKVDSTWLINGKTNVGVAPKIESKGSAEKNELVPTSITTESSKATAVSNADTSEQISSKKINKVLVLYDNGTFEEFLSTSTI